MRWLGSSRWELGLKILKRIEQAGWRPANPSGVAGSLESLPEFILPRHSWKPGRPLFGVAPEPPFVETGGSSVITKVKVYVLCPHCHGEAYAMKRIVDWESGLLVYKPTNRGNPFFPVFEGMRKPGAEEDSGERRSG